MHTSPLELYPTYVVGGAFQGALIVLKYLRHDAHALQHTRSFFTARLHKTLIRHSCQPELDFAYQLKPDFSGGHDPLQVDNGD